MACAPTGCGKTLAFVIPLLHQLQRHDSGGVRALVMSPTKELAEQVCMTSHSIVYIYLYI